MKKMMIALAALSLALAAQATATFTFTGIDTEKYAGYTFYLLSLFPDHEDDASSVALQTFNSCFLAEGARGANTWSHYYGTIIAADTPSFTVNNSVLVIGSYPDNVASTAWTGVLLAVEGGIAAGHYYELFDAAYATSDTATLTPTFDMTNVGVQKTGYLNSDAVPEPTSGLLMLVGMAGLALRRKRW